MSKNNIIDPYIIDAYIQEYIKLENQIDELHQDQIEVKKCIGRLLGLHEGVYVKKFATEDSREIIQNDK